MPPTPGEKWERWVNRCQSLKTKVSTKLCRKPVIYGGVISIIEHCFGKQVYRELTVQLQRRKECSWACLSKNISITLRESLRKRIYSAGIEIRACGSELRK